MAHERVLEVKREPVELRVSVFTRFDAANDIEPFRGRVLLLRLPPAPADSAFVRCAIYLARASSRTSSWVIGLRGWWLRQIGLRTR